ncbi:MAG TPA: hypothetical protein VF875_18095 [Anaeromyxobacter sp.]
MTLARRTVALLAALAAAALAACAHPRSLAGIPGGRPGWVLYHVEELWFRAPRDWHATGDLRHASVQEPDARSKLEITVPEQRFPDERACLAAADERLSRAVAGLERARRHPTRLAGRPGLAAEGDQNGWHVWAIAACDGGVQYQVFFTSATPASTFALDVWRQLVQDTRIGGEA